MSAQRDTKCSVARWLLVGFLTLFLLAIMTPASVHLAAAQQPKKVPRIGFLSTGSPGSFIEAFRQGLRELGYVEGQNLLIEWRHAEGKLDRLPELAAELVRLQVDVIVAAAPSSIRAARAATSTIPIVMGGIGGDPVEAGFVVSLARPGGNITGLTALSVEVRGKQLELLKEIVPKLSRVAVLVTPALPTGQKHALREMERAAGVLKVALQYVDVRSIKDIEPAFQNARKRRADAMLVLSSPVIDSDRTQVADLAAKNRLPTMYPFREFIEAGGLVSYGVSISDLFRRAATYVDKILKGAKPADLPVERPTKFELVINLNAARQIGVTIPPTVLARADRVIK